MSKKITIAFGIDVDAVGGWLGSYGGEDSPGDISSAIFAGESGLPRLVNLIIKYNLPATFFSPGHSIESLPEQFDLTVKERFEIGVNGYSHENPLAMTREQEADILDYCIDLITKRTG